MAYLDGIVNEKIVEEIQRRLDAIKEVDSILDGGCIEQYIEDNTYSPFPQMQITQKPDRVSANLLEGRVAIIVDGSAGGFDCAGIVGAVFADSGGLLQPHLGGKLC